MNIGFDLDKVFIDYPPFIPKWLIDKLYKQKENGELLYKIPKEFEQKIRQISHIPALRKPIKNNLNFLNELKNNKKYNLYLISSRFSFLKNQTENLAKKYDFYDIFKKMYFNFNNKQPHIFKNDVLNKLNLDRFIDDDLSLLKFLSKHQPKTQFYWLNSNSIGRITKNLIAIKDIREFIK